MASNAGAYERNLTMTPQISPLSSVISGLSISSIFSIFRFDYENNTGLPAEYGTSPECIFSYPHKFTLYFVSGGGSGTPLTLTSARAVTKKGAEVPDPLSDFGMLRAAWGTTEAGGAATAAEIQEPFSLDMPTLNQTFDLARNSALRLTWNYSLTPTRDSELNYSVHGWNSPGDIDFSDISSILMPVGTDNSTDLTVAEANHNVFSPIGGLSGSWQWQEHTYLNEESDEHNTKERIDAGRLPDYRTTV
jgi:hypothetical protein